MVAIGRLDRKAGSRPRWMPFNEARLEVTAFVSCSRERLRGSGVWQELVVELDHLVADVVVDEVQVDPVRAVICLVAL